MRGVYAIGLTPLPLLKQNGEEITNHPGDEKMPITIKDFLKLEQSHRKSGKWFQFVGLVENDHGTIVRVRIKSHGFYNQFLMFNDESTVNYCSGHTITKATVMHEFLRSKINTQFAYLQPALS